jgi:hypothetical protein
VPSRVLRRAPAAPEPEASGIAVDFAGGTVAEYLATLKEREDDVNVVLDPEAAGIAMPPVSLKKVSVDTAIHLIQETAAAREGRVYIQVVNQGGGNPAFVVSVQAPRAVPVAFPPRSPGPGQPGAAPEGKQLHVSSLREIMDAAAGDSSAVKAETVLTAIDAALGIQDPEQKDKPVVKFHADSCLLIVRGTQEQIHTVEQVLGEISRPQRAVPGSNLNARLKQLQDEIEKLKAELAELKKLGSKQEN